MTRREFARAMTFTAGGVIGLVFAGPVIGFLLTPLFTRQRPVVERAVTNVSGLPEGVPVRFRVSFPEGQWSSAEETRSLYVLRDAGRYRVFSTVCTHMQCDVHWEEEMQLFLCPCHGGLYNRWGLNVGGPPPKPLPEYLHRIDADGVLYVRDQLLEEI